MQLAQRLRLHTYIHTYTHTYREEQDARQKQMTQQVETMKAEFKKRIEEFNAAVKKLEASGGANMDDVVRICMCACIYVWRQHG